jgi:glycosyltransferase involved in cell wall biosynthesis
VPQPRNYNLCGVNINELNVSKYRGKSKLRYLLSYLHFLVLAFVKCTVLFFRSRMQVIHVHNMPDILVFAGLIPRLLRCKIVLDVHDTVPETYTAKFTANSRVLFTLLRVEEWLSCAFAHRVIAVNHVQRDVIVGRGIPAEKVAVVVTMPVFREQPKSHSATDGQPRFCVVNHGTVSKRLGVDLLIQAAKIVVQEIRGFELHLIGGGDDLDEIVELTANLGLSEHVHFHKGVPWDMLPQRLCGMAVGVVANRVSACTNLMLPSKLIDYVNLNIPAVVPRLRAIGYYFTPDMVSYFEPESVEDIARAIVDLSRNEERRRQQAVNARAFIEKYNWTNQCGLRKMYASLLKDGSENESAGGVEDFEENNRRELARCGPVRR